MNRARIGRLACVLALVVAALLIPYSASRGAPKTDGDSTAAEGETKARGPRLPNYYARLSSVEQKSKLRAVLEEFAPQIDAKRAELQALISKRDAEMDAILTPEQRQEIAQLRAEAAARRQSADSKNQPKKAISGKSKSTKAAE